jgi:hypothetical protein
VCTLKEVQWLGINPFVQIIRGSFVQQIEPAKDAVRMEEVVELFRWAFEQPVGCGRLMGLCRTIWRGVDDGWNGGPVGEAETGS